MPDQGAQESTIKTSKRFWAGMVSFFGTLGAALYAINQGLDNPSKYALEAVEVQVFVWLLSLGGTDAITRAMKEWRLARTGALLEIKNEDKPRSDSDGSGGAGRPPVRD